MKRVILVRHANSEQMKFGQTDFDRVLSTNGQHEAKQMAMRFVKTKIEIDAFVVSAAKRAQETAAWFLNCYSKADMDVKEVFVSQALYLAEPEAFYDTIATTSDELDTIAIFAHNPGILDFANEQADILLEAMPTCGIVAFNIDIQHWVDFRTAKKEFWFFTHPKGPKRFLKFSPFEE